MTDNDHHKALVQHIMNAGKSYPEAERLARSHPRARLRCLSPQDADKVAIEADRPDDPTHRAHSEASDVVIRYWDKRYPLDVAEWAADNGHASDSDAAHLIAEL